MEFTSYMQIALEDYCMPDIKYACGFHFDDRVLIKNIFEIVATDKKVMFEIEVKKAHARVSYILQCEMIVDKKIKGFKVLKVGDTAFLMPKSRNSIELNANLVPITVGEEYAKYIIEQYDEKLLLKPTPIPIEKIIESYGLVIDDRYGLKGTKAEIIFEDCEYETDEGIIDVTEGTILVDKDFKEKEGIGAVRHKLGHEFSHYLVHRNYINIKNIVTKNHLIYKKPGSVRVERQADSLSTNLLMPNANAVNYMLDLYMKHNFLYGDDKSKAMENIIVDMAKTYVTSKFASSIKIEGIGIFIDRMRPSNKYKTYIEKERIKSVYENCELFRKIFDSKKFIYIDSQFVLNNEKYVYDNRITRYAYEHKPECMITFKKYKGHDARYRSKSLAFNPFNDKVYVSTKGNELVLKNAHLFGIDELHDENKYEKYLCLELGECIKQLIDDNRDSLRVLTNVSDVWRHDINDIIYHKEVKNLSFKLAKLCKALELPKDVTIKILKKGGETFDKNSYGGMLYKLIEKGYSLPFDEFNIAIDDLKKLAKVVDSAYEKTEKEKMKVERQNMRSI